MKKFKKLMIAGLATVMAVGVMSSLAACGGKTELIVNTQFGGGDPHETAFQSINSVYLQSHADVRIKDRSGNPTSETYESNLIADMSSKNNLPDVVFCTSGAFTKNFADKFVSVATIQAKYPDYGKNITIHDSDDNSLEMKGTTQSLMYDASKIGDIDMGLNGGLGDWNALKAFFTANKDSNKSLSTNKALSARVDVPHYWFNVLMVKELGIDEFNKLDGTKAFFDTAATKTLWTDAFYNVVSTMKEIGFNAPDAAAPGKGKSQEAYFYEGNYSALLDGTWAAGNFATATAATKDSYKIAAVPGGAKKLNSQGEKVDQKFVIGGMTAGWYITKKAWDDEKKQALAVEYVMTHTTDVSINTYCAYAGGVPANGAVVGGANIGTQGFAQAAVGADLVVAVDDRVPATAKSTLLTDWTDNHDFAKLLLGTTELTKANTTALFDKFIAALE